MKGDFTKFTFDKDNHYRRVLMQQGRVQMDADWNEQIAIGLHRDETLVKDLIGDSGTLWGGASDPGGFAINSDLELSEGNFYVDGILVENDVDDRSIASQPNFPNAALPPSPSNGDQILLYLRVWERHVTALEESSLREVALGGPDTATRAKTIWQVDWENASGITLPACLDSISEWNTVLEEGVSTGALQARATEAEDSDSPCIVTPGGGYRRLENQLYRIEIHTPGPAGTATFKWSRENGTIVATWTGINGSNTDELVVDSTGKDSTSSIVSGDWIELIDKNRELNGALGTLVQVSDVDGKVLTINPATATETISFGDFVEPIIRRWDSQKGEATGEVTVEVPGTNDGYIALEDGVEVKFDDSAAAEYKVGDYWLIPARTATADVEWPASEANPNEPAVLGPHGIKRHFACLAVATYNGTDWDVFDCRNLYTKLTDSLHFHYLGGDGQEVMPVAVPGLTAGEAPEPLRAGVTRGGLPVAGVRVQFTSVGGLGSLTDGTSTGNQVTTKTDADGVATVDWTLDTDVSNTVQKVEAVLLDSCSDEVQLPIVYTAQLSLATHVYYRDTTCSNLASGSTVAEALDTLSKLTSLNYMGGDGQEYMPDQWLPKPLRVRVFNKCGEINDVAVNFSADGDGVLARAFDAGGGVLEPDLATIDTALDVPTNEHEDGVAVCFWKPSVTGGSSRRVIADLQDANGRPIQEPAEIRFYSQPSLASHVYYNDPNCDNLASGTTVANALDTLSKLTTLSYMGGDGQEYALDQWLPQPLEVRVSNKCGEVDDATVNFSADGDGVLAMASEVAEGVYEPDLSTIDVVLDVPTNEYEDGVAMCFWKPSVTSGGNRQVIADLQNANGRPIQEPAEIHFSSRRQPQGEAYPPTVKVGVGGTYDTLLEAFNDHSTTGSVNLQLLPGDHSVADLQVDYEGSIKIVGSGMLSSVINLTGVFKMKASQITLRDVGIQGVNKTASSMVQFDASVVKVQCCYFERELEDLEKTPFCIIGGDEEKKEIELTWSDNQMLVSRRYYESVPVSAGIVSEATPASVKGEIEGLFALDPRTQYAEAKAKAETIAAAIAGLPKSELEAWYMSNPYAGAAAAAESGSPAPRRHARRGPRHRRAMHIEHSASDSSMMLRFAGDLDTESAFMALAFTSALAESANVFFGSIKEEVVTAANVYEGLLELVVNQIVVDSDIALSVLDHTVGGNISGNSIAGELVLIGRLAKDMHVGWNDWGNVDSLDRGSNLSIANNRITHVETRKHDATPEAYWIYNSIEFIGNVIQKPLLSLMGEKMTFSNNQLLDTSEENPTKGFLLGVFGVVVSNMAVVGKSRIRHSFEKHQFVQDNNLLLVLSN